MLWIKNVVDFYWIINKTCFKQVSRQWHLTKSNRKSNKQMFFQIRKLFLRLKWNVTPLIWRDSNFSFFAAFYCSCYGFNALHASLRYERLLFMLPALLWGTYLLKLKVIYLKFCTKSVSVYILHMCHFPLWED